MITTKYFSYLVRIWQGDDLSDGTWLASLEDPSQKRKLYFKSMEELFTFLHERTMLEEPKPDPQNND
jgi:hypothetical protein